MQISEIRKSIGLTQQELSSITGINIWTIRAYEQGTRDIGSMELKKAVALATALNLTAEELLHDHITT